MNPNKHKRKAAARLHEVLADTSGLTDAELRRALQADGVDVNAYLARIKPHAPAPTTATESKPVPVAGPVVEFGGGCEALPLAARTPGEKPGKPAGK